MKTFREYVADLIEMRQEARKHRDWEFADGIRDDLLTVNVILEDHKDGTTTWRRNHE